MNCGQRANAHATNQSCFTYPARMYCLDSISFVSPYFLKEVVLNTWTGELMGFRSMGNFNTVELAQRRYIPHPAHMRTSRGRRQSQRIRNDMDESEAGGRTVQCILCNEFGHRDPDCPTFVTAGALGVDEAAEE